MQFTITKRMCNTPRTTTFHATDQHGNELLVKQVFDLAHQISIVKAEEFLRDQGISMPPPGQFVLVGGKDWLVRNWIAGQTPQEVGYLAENSLHLLANSLAKLHSVSYSLQTRFFYDFAFDPNHNVSDEIKKMAKAYASIDVDISNAVDQLHSKSEVGMQWGPRGLCHCDVKPANMIIGVSPASVTIIDWDKLCNAPQVADLALCLFHLLSLQNTKPRTIRQFLDDYFSSKQVSFENTLLLRSMEKVAAAFMLYDWRKTIDSSIDASLRKVRQKYFDSYCLPLYRRWVQKKAEIVRELG